MVMNQHKPFNLLDTLYEHLDARLAETSLEDAAEFFNKPECLIYQFDVPGVLKENISIDTDEKGLVTISWERKKPEGSTSTRTYGYGKRSFSIATKQFDTENIKAELKDGVLSVTLPKQLKQATKTKIKIE